MKKYFFLVLTAIVSLVFASCSEDISSFEQREGDIDVTYTVSAQSAPTTRAAHDGDGAAKNINRYICEVWHETSEGLTLHKRIENVVAPGQKTTTFTLRLVSKQNYKVLFWADHAEVVGTGEVDGNSTTAADIYYDTKTDKGLQEVTLKKDESNNYVGNNDELDAFYAKEEISTLNETIEQDVTLTRPFAQLNVITTDVDDIRKNAVSSTLNPNKIKMTVNAPTKFDVLTGKASAEEDIEYTAAVYYNISGVTKDDASDTKQNTYCTLAMNYYFAPADEKAVETVNLVALYGDKKLVSPVYANIPLQRNYRTNIIGDLLTDAVKYNVTINPIWTDKKDVNITRVDNIAAANVALAEGKTDLEITMPDDAATQQVVFTTANNSQDITLNFTGAVSGNTITIKNADGASGPASVNVTAPSGTNLEFQNETHVVLNGHDYGTVSGSFSANTLVINEGVTVNKLEIIKGTVEVYGTLNDVTISGTSTDVIFKYCKNLSADVYNKVKNNIAIGYIGKQNENGTWNIEKIVKAKIGSKEYATLEAAMAEAQSGDVIELMEGEFSCHTINNKGTLTFKGQGAGKTTWIHSTSSGYDNYANTYVNFKDIKIAAITASGTNAGYKGFGHVSGMKFENCEFVGMITHWGGNYAHFKNCKFTEIAAEYAMWTYGVKEMKFEGCSFTSKNGKAVNVYCESTSNSPCTYSFNNCTFKNTAHKTSDGVDQCKPALAIKNNGNGTGATKPSYYVININNCSFDGYGQSDGDLYGFPAESPYVNAYGYNSTTHPLKVVVDGITKVNIGNIE